MGGMIDEFWNGGCINEDEFIEDEKQRNNRLLPYNFNKQQTNAHDYSLFLRIQRITQINFFMRLNQNTFQI